MNMMYEYDVLVIRTTFISISSKINLVSETKNWRPLYLVEMSQLIIITGNNELTVSSI